MKKKAKLFIQTFLCICLLSTFFAGQLQTTVYADEELVNVAINEGVKVYTNPTVSNPTKIIDGDNKYQYVTQNARSYIDMSFNPVLTSVDEYNYSEGTYIILDLGKSYMIDLLKIYDFEREGGHVRDYVYDVSLSNDSDFDIDFEYNVNWTKVGEKAKGTGTYVTDIQPPKMMARYIKLGNLQCKGATGFVLSEVEVYVDQNIDISELKQEAISDLNDYKSDLTLNSEETVKRNQIITEYTNKINTSVTTDEIVDSLNEGMQALDVALEFASYRSEKTKEIEEYKNDDNYFSDADRKLQLEELQKAVSAIAVAQTYEEVDAIVAEYKNFVDTLDIMITYEIIPSPHDIAYAGEYAKYYKDINIVSVDGTLDNVTVDYIEEIFGKENVVYDTEGKDNHTNLYLTSDDKDDDVEDWMRTEYQEVINDDTLSKDESHVIIADNNGISIIGNDHEGLFRGLTTIKFIKDQIESSSKGYRHFVINDYADMPFRGLIEGYYGKPWSWEEKAELLEFGSDFKMNKIVYAPKNDPYHTTSWKELYPDASVDAENNIQNIEIAASTARKYKSDLVWTAHCFGYTNLANAGKDGIRYNEGDENVEGSDINLLKAKFQQMYDVGVRSFGLLLDDCDYGPRTLNSPWQAIYNKNQALTDEVLAETTAIVNIMAEWCEEKGDVYDLIFCPAGYVTGWMQNGFANYFKQAYPYQEISYYDIHFKENVQIITTGSAVFGSTDQTMADLFKRAGISAQTGYQDGDERRSPLMWTNHPTVDNDSVLDFGPIANFKTDLNPDDLSGMMSNPFQWAQFNKTVIPMVTQYTWNLKDYDATEVYNNSMKYVMDTDELADAMLIFTNHNNKRGDEGEGTPELNAAINAFKNNQTKETAEALLLEINKVIEACDILLDESRYVTTAMYEQLYPYANSLRDLAVSIKNYSTIFEDGANVLAYLKESDTLYKRHTSYVLKNIPEKDGILKDRYTAVGTRTLLPFANWLRSNESSIMLLANPDIMEEAVVREELESYMDEVISNVTGNYYYGKDTIVKETLNVKKTELIYTNFNELPTLDKLIEEVDELLVEYNIFKPTKNPANLISNDKTVTAGNLEEKSGNSPQSIIDGDPKTTCSTVMGDSTNPAYVQIDLGEVESLEELWIVCYVGGRWYRYDVYTSVDGENFDLLVNKNTKVVETEAGTWFDLQGIDARYIRIVGIDNSVNIYFHVGEIEVYAADVSKVTLNQLIQSVSLLDENSYTQESWAVLDGALTKAKEVSEKVLATQEEVDDATKALKEALDKLKEIVVDKTQLESLLEEAKDLKEEDYTESSWSKLDSALTKAKEVFEEGSAKQEEVDAAAKALKEALDKMEEIVVVDKTQLESLLKEAKELKEEDYTESSWSKLDNALTKAKEVFEEGSVTQEEVDAVAKELKEALDKLEEVAVVNKTQLEALLKIAEGLKKEDYSEELWTVLENALEIAQQVFSNASATQEEVDTAIKGLKEALYALGELEEIVDKSQLDTLLKKAEQLKKENYTVESWNMFEKALQTAKEVFENVNASQEDVNQAMKDLEEAIKNLEELKLTPIKKGDSTYTGYTDNQSILLFAGLGALSLFVGLTRKKKTKRNI